MGLQRVRYALSDRIIAKMYIYIYIYIYIYTHVYIYVYTHIFNDKVSYIIFFKAGLYMYILICIIYNSANKNNEILPFAIMWLVLENIF